MIDSHCHLADRAFAEDLSDVLSRAREASVSRLIVIADSLSEAQRCATLADQYEQIFCTVGVHPHVAKDVVDGDIDRIRVLLAATPKAVAVGEIGLDYHYDHSPRDVQCDVFRTQLQLAKDLGLPSVIHCRESIADLRSIIEEIDPPRFVIHCCTERWQDVAWVVERGSLVSFTGIATYPKSEEIRATIMQCPIEKMMIETDAPYLSPIPHRGKRNEPAFVVEVARCIAELKGLSLQEIDKQTTRNTVEFFGLKSGGAT